MKKVLIIGLVILCIVIVSCGKDDKTPQTASALFFSAYSDSLIGKIDLKNGTIDSNFARGVASGLSNTDQIGLALNTKTGDIYCSIEATNGPIYKVNNSGIATVFFSGSEADEPGGIAYSASNDRVYWINRGDGKVYSIPATGGTPTSLYGGADVNAEGYSIKLDEKNGNLYYANFDEIYKGNLDGSGTPTVLYSGKPDTLESPSSIEIDVDANKIYWTDENTDVVASANLDGSGNIKILYNNATHGVSRSDGLAIDFVAGKIYWTETGDANRIRVGNLDGTGTPVTLSSRFEAYNLLLN